MSALGNPVRTACSIHWSPTPRLGTTISDDLSGAGRPRMPCSDSRSQTPPRHSTVLPSPMMSPRTPPPEPAGQLAVSDWRSASLIGNALGQSRGTPATKRTASNWCMSRSNPPSSFDFQPWLHRNIIRCLSPSVRSSCSRVRCASLSCSELMSRTPRRRERSKASAGGAAGVRRRRAVVVAAAAARSVRRAPLENRSSSSSEEPVKSKADATAAAAGGPEGTKDIPVSTLRSAARGTQSTQRTPGKQRLRLEQESPPRRLATPRRDLRLY
jgi:hypothetical protein